MRLATAFIVVTATVLLLAPSADGGTYTAIQCHDPLGAGFEDAAFARNSPRYTPSSDCRGKGLGVAHEGGRERTRAGRFGAWNLAAPPGTVILRVGARVTAAARDGHVPELFTTLAGGARRFLRGVRGERRRVSWSGLARSVTGRLACSRRTCGAGEDARLHLRRIALMLRDSASPSLQLSGSLFAPGARRGLQAIYVTARDPGAGVRAVAVEVNGDPLPARVFNCDLRNGFALRLRPCPPSEDAWFVHDTTASRFRQGPNRVSVCASDHAYRSEPNRACEGRTVRVDNLCPVSEIPGGALEARFRGGGAAITARGDSRVSVKGRLLGSGGEPIAGGTLCLAATVRAIGRPERVIATPVTDSSGRFAARLPAGPSRIIRIAHWPDESRALERHLTLRARAVPKLRLRPRRRLANGDRLRFAIALPGPAAAGRVVAVEARSEGRWTRIAGGRTSRRGTWRGAYRFRSTTGTRRYAFRATVPKQPGYPYEAGHSRTARATVTG